MPTPAYPLKPRTGDRVAVVSPSAGLPGLFPKPFELGLRRLTDKFGLIPVEYPTTRKMGSTPQERARDLHAAFADPSIKAVLASVGGDDQIRLLPLLDPDLLHANRKPFLGYSDNTNLLAYLFSIEVVGYHGGAVMVEFGRPGRMHPMTAASLWSALFDSGDFELQASGTYGEEDKDWADPVTFESEPRMERSGGWIWHNAHSVVEGVAWGGNLEVLAGLLMADRAVIPRREATTVQILFVETSEEMPSATDVYRILRGMGERGLLAEFDAFLVARAKSWSLDRRTRVCGAQGVSAGAARGDPSGRGALCTREDARLRCGIRTHRSAICHSLRRLGPRRRTGAPHYGAILTMGVADATPSMGAIRWRSSGEDSLGHARVRQCRQSPLSDPSPFRWVCLHG